MSEAVITRLRDLRGLGAKCEEMLTAVGIETPCDLRETGAVGAYVLPVRANKKVRLNMLWALEGALTDRDWRVVARDDRLRLLMETARINGR
jgi:DNA transformation protein